MRVLYVDHTSLVSGAQRALLDLIHGLPPTVEPAMLCPEGPLAELMRDAGCQVVAFPGTEGSLRFHPAQTAKAGAEMLRSAKSVEAAVHATGADIVHANSIRAALITAAARDLGSTPWIAHIHDALPPGRAADLVRMVVRRRASFIVTISNYTTLNFLGDAPLDRTRMLYNPLDTQLFDPARQTQREARAALGLDDAPLIGCVAQITPWKGQDTAIKALALVREAHPEARLLIVGQAKFVGKGTRYDNRAYERWLHRLPAALGVDDAVEFWGERPDVQRIVRALDVAVLPSWAEPFGRSVVEAMALGTPVVATDVGGPPEYIEDGVDGLLAGPDDIAAWAAAIVRLLGDGAGREQMAARGAAKVQRLFNRDDYVSQMVDLYAELASSNDTVARRKQLRDRVVDLV